MEFLQNLLQSDLIWQILMALALLLLFRSVPQSTLDKLEKRATETETSADDLAVKILQWLNANKDLLPELPSVPVAEKPPVTETVTTTTTVTAPFTTVPDTTQLAGTSHTFFTPVDETDAPKG